MPDSTPNTCPPAQGKSFRSFTLDDGERSSCRSNYGKSPTPIARKKFQSASDSTSRGEGQPVLSSFSKVCPRDSGSLLIKIFFDIVLQHPSRRPSSLGRPPA